MCYDMFMFNKMLLVKIPFKWSLSNFNFHLQRKRSVSGESYFLYKRFREFNGLPMDIKTETDISVIQVNL